MAQKGIEKRGHGKAAVNDQKKGRPPNGTLFWILPWRKSNVPVSWQHGKEAIRIPPTEWKVGGIFMAGTIGSRGLSIQLDIG